jgi:hypothetical protein
MKRPAPATIAVFVGILLVAGVVAGILLGGTDGATAIEVGDQKLSREELNDELREWADWDQTNARSTEGAVSGQAGATITTQVVYRMLIERYLDREGGRVTSADRQSARTALDQAAGSAEVPEGFAQLFLDQQATFNALTRVVGEDDQGTAELRVLRREARDAGVRVDRAYGLWAPGRLQVVPFPTPLGSAGG